MMKWVELRRISRPMGRACVGTVFGKWFLFTLAPALCMVMVAAVPAQGGSPPGVRVSLVADSHELTVGDLVTISLLVAHPEDYTVVVPRLEREWGPFEVKAQTSVQTVSVADGIRTVAKQLQVTLFAPGAFETPNLPVSIRAPDGAVAQASPLPILFTVNSVLSSQDNELKDLRPPADLSIPFWQRPIVLVLIVVVAVVVLSGIALFLYRRSRVSGVPLEAAVDTRRPWEVAEQELDQIASLNLPSNGKLKEHYTLVAATLRTYLGSAFLQEQAGQGVGEMSTEEIAARIQESPLDHVNAMLVVELLREADLVKFANYEPTVSLATDAMGQARDFVRATRPADAINPGSMSVSQGAAS